LCVMNTIFGTFFSHPLLCTDCSWSKDFWKIYPSRLQCMQSIGVPPKCKETTLVLFHELLLVCEQLPHCGDQAHHTDINNSIFCIFHRMVVKTKGWWW
jgi:hypothetical protein